MARFVKQFRYYGSNSSSNYPAEVSWSALATGNIFEATPNITQLGIQTYPGLKFYVNNSANPIMVGATGIYELDLEGLGSINSIRIDRNSLDEIDHGKDPIMIDIIYEGAGIA